MTVGGCTKQRHRDRTKADRSARALRERGVPGAHVYRCTGCHAWHVGSTLGPPPGRRDRTPAPPPPRRAEVDDPPGTRYCVDGCGHRADLHAAGICLGNAGACTCTARPS